MMEIFGAIVNVLVIIILIVSLIFAILSTPRKGKGLFCAFIGLFLLSYICDVIFYRFFIQVLYDSYSYRLVDIFMAIMRVLHIAPFVLLLVYVIVSRNDTSSSMVYQQGDGQDYDSGQYGQDYSTDQQEPAADYGYDQGQQGNYAQPANMNYNYGGPVTLSKGLYLGGYLGGFLGTLIFYVIGFLCIANREEEAGIAMILIGLAIALLPAILIFIMVYKMWKAIQPYGQTTPGKAVGFMFIPFYNLYWIFVAYKGWFEDYNNLVDEKNLDVPRLPVGIAMTVCILMLCGMIPYLGMIASLVNIIMICIMISSICNGVNALAAYDLTESGGAVEYEQDNYTPESGSDYSPEPLIGDYSQETPGNTTENHGGSDMPGVPDKE